MIRKFLAGLLALCLVAGPAPASVTTTGAGQAAGGGGGGGGGSFTFTDAPSAVLSTTYASNAITAGAGALTLSGDASCQYNVNGGTFGSTGTTTAGGEAIIVRGTGSASTSTAINCLLTIGANSDTFTVTTVVNSEASVLMARQTDPGAVRRGYIDTAFGSLKNGATSGSNLLTKVGYLYVFWAAADEASARQNWLGNTFNATYLATTPGFLPYSGFTGDGSTQAIDSGFAISSQNASCVGEWPQTQTLSSPGETGNATTTIGRRASGNNLSYRINQASIGTVTSVTNGAGLFLACRNNSTTVTISQNATVLATQTVSSTTPDSGTFFILGRRFSPNQFSAIPLGAALAINSDLTAAEKTDVFNTLDTLRVAMGAPG